MPVNTARARQAWPSARASGEVIHWLWPLDSAVVPSSDAAIFMRTQAPGGSAAEKRMLSSRDSQRQGRLRFNAGVQILADTRGLTAMEATTF
jgi:hypothetical protein